MSPAPDAQQPQPSVPAPAGAPLKLLRLEGLAVFLGALALYWMATSRFGVPGAGWWTIVLFFAPDLSILAYLLGPRRGALAYNCLHSYAAPLILIAMELAIGNYTAANLLLLWVAHIGLDRALGYGLKYPDAFGSTHLGRAGRSNAGR